MPNNNKNIFPTEQDNLWGEVNISQPISYKVLTYLLTFTIFIILIFLVSSDYRKKQNVRGFLAPSQGVLKTYSPGSFYISEIMISEGEIVSRDQPLFRLEYRRGTNSGVDLNEKLAKGVREQIVIIEAQKRHLKLVYENKKRELMEEINNNKSQLNLLKLQKKFTESRRLLAEKRLNDFSSIRKKGYLSGFTEEKQKDQLLILEQESVTIDTNLSQLHQKGESLKLAFNRLPMEEEKELQLHELNISMKKNELTEIEGQSQVIIRASKGGVISSLAVKEGQLMKLNQYMVSLLPTDDTLNVELFIPTRAFGFVDKGQTTRVKIDAFPYQKFGIVEAVVFEVTENILLPNEVSLPIVLTEPVYRVKARLENQTVKAYGKQIALRPGMLLEADILIDSRSLAEWLLEPIFSLYG